MNCRICGQPTPAGFVKRGHEVRRCRQCGYLWMVANGETPPVDYSKLYGETYYGGGEGLPDDISRYDLSDILESKMPQARAAVQLVRQFKHGGRLLDIGCSAGVFVKAARDAGFDASGIDVSEVAVRFAREQLGVEARATTLEAADFGAGSFDAITMWDVLEHFEDPWRALQTVDEWLAPGGVLALRTPNTRCLRTRLCGYPAWDMISPPEHYHLFARQSLTMFLNQLDFSVVHLATVHSDWIYYRRVPAWKKFPFHLSGAVGWGGDLVAIARRHV